MALTKEVKISKIEIVGDYKSVQYAKDTIVKEDGKQLAKNRWRRALDCGWVDFDDSNKWHDTDISSEPSEIQTVCNQQWTQAIKDSYKQYLIDSKG